MLRDLQRFLTPAAPRLNCGDAVSVFHTNTWLTLPTMAKKLQSTRMMTCVLEERNVDAELTTCMEGIVSVSHSALGKTG